MNGKLVAGLSAIIITIIAFSIALSSDTGTGLGITLIVFALGYDAAVIYSIFKS